MKKGYFVFFILIPFIITLYAGAFLRDFRGYNEGENIKIEWETAEESNLRHFIIERKNPESSYIDIATVLPKGSNSFYTYVDEGAYKLQDFIFVYRLKIVENNGQTSYSSTITVTQNVSSFKRTWGSIKAMFR